MGLVSSLGNSCQAALDSLKAGRSGIGLHEEMVAAEVPYVLAGLLEGFYLTADRYDEWSWPEGTEISRVELRSLPPHGVYAHVAMQEALAQSGLSKEALRDPRVGLVTAAAGSAKLSHRETSLMMEKGISSCSPMMLTNTICGGLTFNLASSFGIQGVTGCCVSACASSAQALGTALDQIRLGRQDVVVVVGAEDADLATMLPFGSLRAMTTSRDPNQSPCCFDVRRDGFAPTGGAAVLILESEESAQKRGAETLADFIGWGWASDGHHPVAPDPNGAGLERAMIAGFQDAGIKSSEVGYVNAHAPSTPAGDLAEMRALKRVFTDHQPRVASTKSSTGHALSMAGALEAVLTILTMKEGFVPANLNLETPDPEMEGLSVSDKIEACDSKVVMSNSSGFGGTNVSLLFQRKT